MGAAGVAAVVVVALIAGTGSSGRQVRVGDTGSSTVTVPSVSVPLGSTPPEASLSIPSSPSGAAGTSSNPFGSPAASLASCAAAATTPARVVSVTLTNKGFDSPCYTVSATGVTAVGLTNNITNDATGLTVAADLTVSTILKPVVAQATNTGPDTPSMPGLTVPEASPTLDVTNAIYTSPTDPDSTPITFDLPALPAGQYLLQLPTAAETPAAVLTVLPNPALGSPPTPPVPVSGPNTPGATANEPTSADEAALTAAFEKWESLPQSCPANIVTGSDRLATVTSDGTTWAVATFQPDSSCVYNFSPATPGGPARVFNADQIGPFANSGLPRGVFEKAPGGSWTMNEEGGTPFPCPAAGGDQPGRGNGALPASVLTAWNLTYASNCAFPIYPPQPPT